MSDEETYYEALGVEPDASRDELKNAYQERVSELEAAREGKNVGPAQLQSNREEVARVPRGVERPLRPLPTQPLRRAARIRERSGRRRRLCQRR